MAIRARALKLRLVFAATAALTCLCGCATTPIAPPPEPPPPKHGTLWGFLGIPQCCQRLKTRTAQLLNRSGRFPGLEPVPPPLLLADPANEKSKSPGVAAAAELKKQEDDAQQSVKAIRYLAEFGCGCYDREEGGKISKALVDALDVCNEPIRFEAASTLARLSAGEACQHCAQKRCCNPKIIARLTQLAYDQDEMGCWKEPSARVRRKAIIALTGCPLAQPEAAPENIPPGEKTPPPPTPPATTPPPAPPLAPPTPADREFLPEPPSQREVTDRTAVSPGGDGKATPKSRVGWQPERAESERR